MLCGDGTTEIVTKVKKIEDTDTYSVSFDVYDKDGYFVFEKIRYCNRKDAMKYFKMKGK